MQCCGQCGATLNPRCSRCGFENPAGIAFCGQFAGVLAHFFPKRGLSHCAVHREPLPTPSRPRMQHGRPPSKARKTSALVHSGKRQWAERLKPMPVSFGAYHGHPVRGTTKMASITFRSSARDRSHPQGCGSRAGSSSAIYSHSLSGGRQSGVGFLAVIGRQRDSCRREFFPTEYYQNSLLR
jgi:hypothetical protein